MLEVWPTSHVRPCFILYELSLTSKSPVENMPFVIIARFAFHKLDCRFVHILELSRMKTIYTLRGWGLDYTVASIEFTERRKSVRGQSRLFFWIFRRFLFPGCS